MVVQTWGNPILHVDLETGAVEKMEPEPDTRGKFLLGRGLGDWLLMKHVKPGTTDPLSPANVIAFGSGILVGTGFPGAVRTSMVSLNVLTGGYGESSCGGFFAARLKQAGSDGLLVSGRSPEPVFLWIEDGRVEIRGAAGLMGKTTFETSDAIKTELRRSDVSVCAVGPAGEKLVRYALINCDNRYAGRCGMGAVMGSKNLKAIAVRGTGSVEVSDRRGFAELERRVRRALTVEPALQSKARYGLGKDTEAYNDMGLLPVKNFQAAGFDGISGIGYDAVRPYYKKVVECASGCPVRCDRLVEIPEGQPYGGTRVSALEATPAYNMAKLLVDDMPTVIKAFELCNGHGIDMHAWSTCMQWAIECFERGILTRSDTDKLDLRWGDGPMLLDSIRRIAHREGAFGDLLAEGVARASRKTGRGSENYAMHVRGMEIDDELRVDKGMAFGILTEPRGSGHTLGAFFGSFDRSLTREEAKRLYGTENAARAEVYEDKADLVVHTERYGAVQDCLGICWFASHRAAPRLIEYYHMGVYAALIGCATGRRVSEEELVEIAERILTLEKSINILAGMRRKDEYPPRRFFEPIPGGPKKGMKLDRLSLDGLFRRHSELHGWDPETGVPRGKTLENLGLIDIVGKIV
jgi:aldehyde:ferredoxin oxidoreductase